MAVNGQEQARDEVVALFKATWDVDVETSAINVLYPNDGQKVPDGTETSGDGSPLPWARFSMLHNPAGGFTATLAGATGSQKERSEGFIFVEIYLAPDQGLRQSDKIAKIVKDIFRGKSTSPGGVEFRNISTGNEGPDGVWYRMDVQLEFTYDEIV